MIFELLFFILFGLLSVITGFMPDGSTLPWGMDPIMVQISSYWHGAMQTLPYLSSLWTVFLIALGFEIALMFMKLALGSRAPHTTN